MSLRKQSKSKDAEINKDTEHIKPENIQFENMADTKELDENKVEQSDALFTNKGKKDVKLKDQEQKKVEKPNR